MIDTLILTDDDLDTLSEALEAWESKDAAGDLAEDMLDSALRSRLGAMPAEVDAQRQAHKAEREQSKKQRKERSVLLRAKLIQIRDQRHAERLTSEALR